MVKFSKQLELQLVPEWRHKFCDYWQLKKLIKRIRLHRLQAAPDSPCLEAAKPVDGTWTPLTNLARRKNLWCHENVIKVHQHKSQQEEVYETELLEPLAQDEYDKTFFTTLDAELNKVNQFFCAKEQEFVERLDILRKQLDNLTDISNTCGSRHGSSSFSSSRSLLSTILFGSRSSGRRGGGEESEENSMHPLNNHQHKVAPFLDSPMSSDTDETLQFSNSALGFMMDSHVSETNNHDEEKGVAAPPTSGDSSAGGVVEASPTMATCRGAGFRRHPMVVATFATLQSFTRTLLDDRSLSKSSSSSSLAFTAANNNSSDFLSKRNLKYANKMLRTAFVEFYRGLGLLRTFSSLNMLAFAKILKKYDKVTGRQASPTYMKVVEKAHFSTSDKVIKMMDEVETLFIEHFAKDDEKKAMMLLRPVQPKAPHTITFFLGLFSGCSAALLLAFGILLHISKEFQTSRSTQENYFQVTYQVFSMLFLILLHMYIYGWNVYAWRKTRINYAFIFEFAPKTELRNREVLLVSTGLTTMVLAGMVSHLVAYSTPNSHINPDYIPLITILALLFILVNPLNICYRSSRVYFLGCMKRVVLSPFYKVILADFFLADQLTSQVAALRCLQFIMCYYFGGYFHTHNAGICNSEEFRFLAYLISFLPYWWRLMQCLRRWFDEGDKAHLANGGKYFSAMIAAAARISFSYQTTFGWQVIFVITSSFATLYQMYWDIVRDWGFFQPNSENAWLRDQLILKNKSVYYFSIALNFVLRFAWLQQVTHWQIKKIEHSGTDLFFASLEVIRRGHWNFYRLENEHLNNVGKYRAVKLVPLPFRDAYDNHT